MITLNSLPHIPTKAEVEKYFKNLKRKRKQSKKELLKKSFDYNFGEQDQVDIISYSGLEENTTYLQVGDKFVRTLFISGYPYVASTGWLNIMI